MVSSIVPGGTGAGALAIDPRMSRPAGPGGLPKPDTANGRGDSVEIGDAATWSATRESVRVGLAEVRDTLAFARDAQNMLLQVQALMDENAAQSDLDALLQAYAERTDGASGLAAGAELSIFAEPGAPAVRVAGVDLRLKDEPAEGDLIAVARGARIDDDDLGASAQRSLDALQGVMERLTNAARSLEAHLGFLSAADGALAANQDLDADGARLLALQVRQGLVSAGAIANVEPQAVLALFKA